MFEPILYDRHPVAGRTAIVALLQHDALTRRRMRLLALGCPLLLLLGACEPATPAADRQPDSIAASPPSPQAGAPAESIAATILRIRDDYEQADRDSARFRCRTQTLEGFSAEGGELVTCYDGESLRVLTARHYGEMGRATERFYFRDAQLEFVLRRDEQYTAPLSGEVRSREEQRLFFDGGRLVFWIGPDDVERPVHSLDAEREAAERQELARKFAACALDPAQSTCTA